MASQTLNGQHAFEWLPTQRRALGAIGSMKYSSTLYSGGFGSGKSRFLGEAALELSINYPGSEFLFWRKTRASIKDTTYRIFMEQVIPPEMIAEHNKSSLTVKDCFGSRYDFLGLDKVTRKGSYWGDAAMIDECIELEEPEIRMIEGRLRSKHLPRPQLIAVTNPGAPGSFWHREFVKPDAPRPMHAYFAASSFENIHNPKEYFERLEQWKGSQYYDRYVLAQWKAYRGSVYETFDPVKFVIDPFRIPENWRRFMAVDFGFDHPLVILWIAEEPILKRLYVYRQYFHTHVLVRDAAKLAKVVTEKAGESIEDIWADHDSENRAQFETDWRETRAARKEVAAGIQHVQMKMLPLHDGLPGIQIFNDSWRDKEGFWYGNLEEDLILKEENRPYSLQTEIPGYKWGKDDKPVKLNDDADDAIRYGLFSDAQEEMTYGGTIEATRQNTVSRR